MIFRVLALAFGLMLATAAHVEAGPAIPAEKLQADFEIFRRVYEELHPGLYRYNSKDRMDAEFKALRAELARDLTLREAYLAFSIFLAKIKCGHSYANFYNQPKAVADELFKGRDKVPFYFRWIGRRMIVTRNFSEEGRLKPGVEVLSINGVPAGRILDKLMTVARADGSNDAKRVSYLEIRGDSNYEAFDIYFPLFFPQADSRMELRVRRVPGGRPLTLSVAALTYDQRLAPVKAETAKLRGSEPLWDYSFDADGTAYLRMPTWALFNSKWDWKGFLDGFFDSLVDRKAPRLIIDLRGNEGGLSIGDSILARLTTREIRLSAFRRKVRYRSVPEDLRPYLDTWDRSFFNWGGAAIEPNGGFYLLKRPFENVDGNVIKPAGRSYQGRTYVLIGAVNSSATFEFAQAVRQHQLATLAGQATGGNQRGINGGAFFFLRLPNTGIEIDVPLIGFFADGERPDAGITPDLLIQPRIEDIVAGIDTELNFLRRRFRN